MKLKLNIKNPNIQTPEELRTELISIYDFNKFSSEELESLKLWQSTMIDGICADITSYLRGNKDYCSPKIEKHINNLYNACNKIKLPHDITVFRGTNYFDVVHDLLDNYPLDVLIDYKYTDKCFISTSISTPFNRPVVWEIKVTKGTSCVYLEKLVPNGISPEYETELLIQKDTEIKIRKINKNNNEVYIFATI